MSNNPRLHIQQTQKLQLSPQLKQAVALLQLSSIDLEDAIEEALAENPLLEKQESSDADDLESSVSADAPVLRRRQEDDDDNNDWLESIVDEPDFYDALHNQVCEITDDERQSQLLHILIEYLDEHGYLTDDLEYIIEHSPLEWRLEMPELAEALSLLKQLDPAGVGAKNIQESLLLQVARMSEDACKPCMMELIEKHFDILQQPNPIAKMQKSLRYDVDIIQKSLKKIRHLNPYPSNGYASNDETVYVKPDVRVVKKQGRWQVIGESHLRPRLVINSTFAQAVQLDGTPEWKQKLADAKNWIHNLEWRENTIIQVARAIVEHQQDFFHFGKDAMQPLQMTQLAEQLNLSVATVSRSVNQKYLICPQGLFELRIFFSNNSDGSEDGMSATAIKSHIATWIKGESPENPLSDDDLRQKLLSIGIHLSRRTVAKYREAMNIPSSYYRKKT